MSVPMVSQSEQSIIEVVNKQLREWKSKGAHILAPMTLQTVPSMHRPVVSSVLIDPNPNNKEVYPQRGGGLSLSAIAFKKLGDAMGIQWLPEECGRRDDGTDPDRVEYRMTGLIKALDGTWRKIIGDKEIRLSVIREELTDSYRERAKKYLDDPKDGPSFRRQYPTEAAVEQWVAEKVRQDALQMKKHMLARAQSGALARATKSIGIRETYTPQELQKPFVFPKLVFTPDENNPQDRAFLLAQGAGAIGQLYAQPVQASQSPHSMTPIPQQAPREVVFFEAPVEQPLQVEQKMDSTDSLRADFQASDPKGQAEVLTTLIKQKAYTGKIAGDMATWKPEARHKFFENLMGLPDVNAGGAALPFE